MADTGEPLMRLKDLLELDCESCSAAGFRCYPRRLGESSPAPLSFCRSPSSFRRSSNKLSHISRSLSRRLRGSFWWRRSNDDEEEAGAAVVHGCGCSYEPDTPLSESSDSSSRTRSRSGSDSDFSSASSASETIHDAVAIAGDEHEDAMKKRGAREEGSSSGGSEADDKEQLSPVAVMDFLCFDDDYSPSSDDSLLSRLRGAREAHKIRRFRNLDKVGAVDLEARLVASPDADDNDDVPARQLHRHTEETTPRCPSSRHHGTGVHEEEDENGLLVLLTDTVSAGVDVVTERLLLDFFVEMNVERRSERAVLPAPAGSLPRKAERLGDNGEILAAARGWLLDGAGWGLEDVLRGGAADIAEMERGQRWMQVGEEREVGVVVASVLADQIVDEVVGDLLWL
ncbi:hypothetical protein QOZ80_2AG0114380 [Eleusine coracana subsp. coracana]|nr:hypothetical protein QOZ80_2AG0114380 [Eleusine coracana subsp. coracana]